MKAALPVEIASPIYDFGEVFGGTEVEHIFTFTNRGDEVLEITNVESSCYCTTGFLSDTRIPPGETGKIKVAFKAPPRSEVIHEVVKLTTNQSELPLFELAVKASVITPFEAIPASLLLGKISPIFIFGQTSAVTSNISAAGGSGGDKTEFQIYYCRAGACVKEWECSCADNGGSRDAGGYI